MLSALQPVRSVYRDALTHLTEERPHHSDLVPMYCPAGNARAGDKTSIRRILGYRHGHPLQNPYHERSASGCGLSIRAKGMPRGHLILAQQLSAPVRLDLCLEGVAAVMANCDCPTRAGKPTYPARRCLSSTARWRAQPRLLLSAAMVRAP